MVELTNKVQRKMNNELLDAAVAKSREQCPGGDSCTCCRPGCDCGCRNDCPRFRYEIRKSMAGRPTAPGWYLVRPLGQDWRLCQVGACSDGTLSGHLFGVTPTPGVTSTFFDGAEWCGPFTKDHILNLNL